MHEKINVSCLWFGENSINAKKELKLKIPPIVACEIPIWITKFGR